jgi:hypothetical protein
MKRNAKMKKITVLFTCLVAVLLMGCRAHMPVAQQSGKEDVAYLLFVSQSGAYHKKAVTVDVDGQQYQAEGVRPKDAQRRGTQYSAPTGTHQLTVKSADGQVLYSKKVFLSAQEVKNITLP